MALAIRHATLEDVALIKVIEQQTPTASHWPTKEYAKLIGVGIVLVAEESDELRGFLCAQLVADEWELENIVVASKVRRTGVADALMCALIEQAERSEVPKILLEVRESNLAARHLYDKHGFREIGRRRNYYQNPEEDAVLYALVEPRKRS